MITPHVAEKHGCCNFCIGAIVIFDTGYVMLFFQKPINYYEDSVIFFRTLQQAYYKVYCQVNPWFFRNRQGLKKAVVCILRNLSLFTHVAIAKILLNLFAHGGPIIMATNHIEGIFRTWVAYCRLVVHFVNDFHTQMVALGNLHSIPFHQLAVADSAAIQVGSRPCLLA